MLEISQLEKLAIPLKWGFLADNLLLLLRRVEYRTTRLEGADVELVRGARELLELTEAGVKNMVAAARVSGDLGRIVESLMLYNYVAASIEADNASFERVAALVGHLKSALDRWLAEGIPEESSIGALRKFFKSISEVTLRETNENLSPSPTLSIPE